jgi:hypothetical protein
MGGTVLLDVSGVRGDGTPVPRGRVTVVFMTGCRAVSRHGRVLLELVTEDTKTWRTSGLRRSVSVAKVLHHVAGRPLVVWPVE